MQRYLEGEVSRWTSLRQDNLSFFPGEITPVIPSRAGAETRIWYNSEQESCYFLIPGVTVLIMTLIGTLLASLVIAGSGSAALMRRLRPLRRGSWRL